MSRKKISTVAESATTRTETTRAKRAARVREPKDTNVSINEVLKTKVRLKCRNHKQKDFINLIEQKEIVIASGPAGVGKSYVAIAKALELIQEDPIKYQKLAVIKPAVEAGENLGFIPGTLKEKMEPHLASSMDIIDKLIGQNNRVILEEAGVIKVEPLGFLRGKTIDNTILIMEEAQNMSPHQMKTLLTRIGENTKFIISGDLHQSDKYEDASKSGLYDVIHRLKNIQEIGFFEFNEDDIVRNPLITKILKTYIPKPKVEKLIEDAKIFVKVPNPQPQQTFKIKVPVGKEKKPNWFQRNFKW